MTLYDLLCNGYFDEYVDGKISMLKNNDYEISGE